MQREAGQSSSAEVEAMRNRIKELEDQMRWEREQREQQVAVIQTGEQERLNRMNQDNQRAFLDVHVKVDKNLFEAIINFTKGIFTTITSWFSKK